MISRSCRQLIFLNGFIFLTSWKIKGTKIVNFDEGIIDNIYSL